MAPQVTYATAGDIESVILATPPPAQSTPWALYLSGLLGLACTAVLVMQTVAPGPAQLQVQAQPRVVVPVQRMTPAALGKPAEPSMLQKIGSGLATLSLTAMANLGTPYITPAAELDILSTPTPTADYIFDDGSLLSKATLGDLTAQLPDIESRTGYRINVVTLRKLVSSDDAFQFADNLIETWYPTAELGDKKAVLVLVKNSKEGGLVGGPSFNKAVPDSVVESVVNDNIAELVGKEKFNQAVKSTVDRLDAVLSGRADPGPPKSVLNKAPEKPSATYKTKDETDEKRGLYSFAFGALVIISFVAPMVQFFTYTKDD